MKRLNKLLEHSHHYLTKKDWDCLAIIDGDVGMGKSNLGEHALDYWQTKKNGICVPKDIKHINLSKEDFVKDLRTLNRFGMTIYDEAGDLSNLRTMNKFNYTMSLTYTIIRGLNLFSWLILPSIFRLNSYFVRDRARFYIRVYARGRMAVWDKERIRKIIAINQSRVIKNPFVVRPLFYDTFPIYKGVLQEGYKIKKEKRLNSIRDELLKSVEGETEKNKQLEIMTKIKNIVGTKQTAKIYGCSERTIYNRLKEFELPAQNEE